MSLFDEQSNVKGQISPAGLDTRSITRSLAQCIERTPIVASTCIPSSASEEPTADRNARSHETCDV